MGRAAPPIRTTRWLALICLIHVGLGLWYSIANPPFEGPDETGHFAYIKRLADGAGLPVQPETPVVYDYRQEGSQAPLYYLLSAALIAPIDTGPPGPGFEANPHASVGQPHALGNRNVAIARPADDAARQGVRWAVYLIRAASVLLGTVAVWATFGLTRQILPAAPDVALLAATWVAFLPQFLFISGSVSNDTLAATVAAVTLLAINRAVRQPRRTRHWVLVGTLGGIAALSKLNGAGINAVAVLALAWCGWRSADRRWLPGAALATLGLPALIGGWWYLRNWLLYRDPTGLSALLDQLLQRQATWQDITGELTGVWYSLWGVFGWFNVLLPEGFYLIYGGLALIALAGLAVQAVLPNRRHAGPINWVPLTLALLWLALIGAALIRYMGITLGGQGRLLFPALTVLGFLFAWGLVGWLPRRRRTPWVVASVAIGLALLAGYVPAGVIPPAYAVPVRWAPDQRPTIPNPIDVNFAGQIDLLGYQIGRPDGAFGEARPGQPLAITLYWQARQPITQDFSVFVHLLDRQGRLLGQANSYPGAGRYPTSLWQPGEIVQDITALTIDPGADLPTLARLEAGLYQVATFERVPAGGDRARANNSVFLTDLRIGAPTAPPPFAQAAGLVFGDQIELLDHALEAGRAVPAGTTLHLDLRWRALRAVPTDYTVFIHLIDETGRLVAQADAEPRAGTYPTSVWEAGEIVADRQTLTIPPNTVAGRHDLRIGLYRRATGERLAVPGHADGAAVLTTIAVAGR